MNESAIIDARIDGIALLPLRQKSLQQLSLYFPSFCLHSNLYSLQVTVCLFHAFLSFSFSTISSILVANSLSCALSLMCCSINLALLDKVIYTQYFKPSVIRYSKNITPNELNPAYKLIYIMRIFSYSSLKLKY